MAYEITKAKFKYHHIFIGNKISFAQTNISGIIIRQSLRDEKI